VVANNQFAYSTPTSRQFVCKQLVDKALGYGVEAHRVDGTDLAACLEVMGCAVGRARAGAGPQLVEAELLRLCGHGEHDDASYVPAEMKASALGRDCLERAAQQLVGRGWVTMETVAAWTRAAEQEVDKTVARCQREPAPDPYTERWEALSTRGLMEGRSGDAN
jgi:pyruvate dehydrogenase E1 component alpha subunit/2-oxoisovalerate dehydrogenase E1 component alpha subunit